MERPQLPRFGSSAPGNPFGDSNANSIANSIADHSSISSDRISRIEDAPVAPGKHRFISYKLNGEYERPWIGDKRMKKDKWNNWIIWAFVLAGCCLSGYINYTAVKKVQKLDYCLIMDDSFKTIDPDNWFHEVQVNGFGSGSFDWTTTDERNSYVDDEGLHIMPTLTTDSGITRDEIFDGYTLNLTQAGGDGSCTGTSIAECSVHSNGSQGIIIPPAQSARLSTRGKKGIRYGRIEVTARMPKGDWLWPAIWMMPEDSVYGDWPRSGEIDISEARGNDVDYPEGGRDRYMSTIHWGPTSKQNAYWKATRGRELRRTDFTKGFHTFGFEWSEDHIMTYIDTPLQQVLYWNFKGEANMWDRGSFNAAVENSTLLADPWTGASNNAPFDQKFYLILNVAVGSRNGWFLDGKGDKPWTDGGNSAYDFYRGIDQWLPTWGEGKERGMTVRSVKMWQQGKC